MMPKLNAGTTGERTLRPWPAVAITDKGPMFGMERIQRWPAGRALPHSYYAGLRETVTAAVANASGRLTTADVVVRDDGISNLTVDLSGTDVVPSDGATIVREALVAARGHGAPWLQGSIFRHVEIRTLHAVNEETAAPYREACAGSGLPSVVLQASEGDRLWLRDLPPPVYPMTVPMWEVLSANGSHGVRLWQHLAETSFLFPDLHHEVLLEGLGSVGFSGGESARALAKVLMPTVQGALLAPIIDRSVGRMDVLAVLAGLMGAGAAGWLAPYDLDHPDQTFWIGWSCLVGFAVGYVPFFTAGAFRRRRAAEMANGLSAGPLHLRLGVQHLSPEKRLDPLLEIVTGGARPQITYHPSVLGDIAARFADQWALLTNHRRALQLRVADAG